MFNQILQAQPRRNLTVVGFFPNGSGYESVVEETTPFEAKISVLSDQRYLEDGGDLSISCVLDATTGELVDNISVSGKDLFSEFEAVEIIVGEAASVLSSLQQRTAGSDLGPREVGELLAYVAFFEFLLCDEPQVFEGFVGTCSVLGEDLMVQFEDTDQSIYEFLPSQALLELAKLVAPLDTSGARLQVERLVQVGGSSLDRAINTALD